MSTRRVHLAVGRGLDIVLLILTAIVWVPLLGLCAAAVLVGSGRPILFRQERMGRSGALFSMVKFRSMAVGDNPLIPDDAHVTAVGAVLRRWSLDELPQVLNVLAGSMSLVGPRPMLPEQAAMIDHEGERRHSVRPGLTGIAQVSGRNTITWGERFVHDLAWADNPTVGRYLSTIVRTVAVVVGRDGVAGHQANDPFVSLTSSSGKAA